MGIVYITHRYSATMNRTLRHILFIVFIIFFVATSAIILAYASGYRVTRRGDVVKTGILFVNGKPRDAQIFLNQKPVGAKLPLRLPHLIPGSYHIRVIKDGHRAWEKTLDIRPRETTFATEIVLWKQSGPEQYNTRADVQQLTWDGDDLIMGGRVSVPAKQKKPTVKTLSQQEKRFLLWESASGNLMLAYDDTDTPPQQLSISASQEPIVAWNPDIKRWLIATSHELWLLGSDGALTLIERTSIPIKTATFLADHPYVLTHTGDEIRILELDDRDRRNVVTIITRPAMRAVTVNAAATLMAFADDEGVWVVKIK